ncbi:MAG: Hpt domain-containing protein, partial [Spirochaetaceae bacterium]|nr:Hpt domain-containing protein [Spirochaetaceae bacterium]
MASEFTSTFLRDTADLLESLKNGSGKIEIARALHSLKSGASFLGWEDLEQEAHSLEEAFGSSQGFAVNWRKVAGRLEKLVEKHASEASSGSRKKTTAGRAIRFTELEQRVLEESRQRKEHFYRLTCRIDPSEPLPYPRAYLLSSKLETGMTLIKSEPPMDNPEADFTRPTFWFTTDAPESDVFMAANIDLVDVVSLIRLDYRDILESGEVPAGESSGAGADEDTTLIVDRSLYAETIQIAEELAWRLESRPGTPESTLSSELQRSLESLAFSPLEPMLTDIGAAVSRLSERRGLKARFEWTVASGGLDAVTLESLGEVLRQLVKNSLRHGLEP